MHFGVFHLLMNLCFLAELLQHINLREFLISFLSLTVTISSMANSLRDKCEREKDMRAFWIWRSCITNTHISKNHKHFQTRSVFCSYVSSGYWVFSHVPCSLVLGRPPANIVLLLQARGLWNNVWGVWFLWRMSFRDPHLSAPCLHMRVTQVRVEAGFSKQSLPVALSPSPLSSCHSDPFQSHAAALTSLPQPFPAFCLNPSTPAQVTLVLQHCAKTQFALVLFFSCLEVVSALKCQPDQNAPEITEMLFF